MDQIEIDVVQEHSILRAPVILHAISSLEASFQQKSAALMLKGIIRCIEKPGPLKNEMLNSPDFWAILKTIHSVDQVAPSVFKVMEDLSAGDFSSITADNYEVAVLLLNDFASAGSIGSILEQKQDALSKRGKPTKQNKPQSVSPGSTRCDLELTVDHRENDVVRRGIEAVRLIYRLSGRVQTLIQQSHLEAHEGKISSIQQLCWSRQLLTLLKHG